RCDQVESRRLSHARSEAAEEEFPINLAALVGFGEEKEGPRHGPGPHASHLRFWSRTRLRASRAPVERDHKRDGTRRTSLLSGHAHGSAFSSSCVVGARAACVSADCSARPCAPGCNPAETACCSSEG